MSLSETISYVVATIAILGVFLSLISFYYTYHQNKRKIEVNIDIDYTEYFELKLCAFNSGYRSVALIKAEFCINKNPFHIKEGWHGDTIHNQVWISQSKKIEFPYGLNEGHVLCYTFSARSIADYLLFLGYSGDVELSGYFKTGQRNIVESANSISFNIEKYSKVEGKPIRITGGFIRK